MSAPRQQETVYGIRVHGHLDPVRLSQFECLSIEHTCCETVIQVAIADQSALFGLLNHLKSLGVTLLTVNRLAI
jgi:hypothetical protein